jgi:hypothetical protein
MLTLFLQFFVPVVLGAFAVLALLISRQPRGVPEPHRTAWRVTAVVYLPYTAVHVAQSTFACVAYFAGAGHPLYHAYLWVAPMTNHSRTFVSFVFYAALFLLARKGSLSPRQLRGVGWATAAGMLAGAGLGVAEGPLVAVTHFINTVFADIAGFVVLGALLLYLIVRDTVDRDLWFGISLHGILSLVGALYLTAMSLIGYGRPSGIWQLHLIRLVTVSIIVAFALHRYRKARQGIAVHGMVPINRYRAALG